jgi:phage-related minor tail protein
VVPSREREGSTPSTLYPDFILEAQSVIFYIVAAILAALKIAGVGLVLSWWIIVGIALIPLAIALSVLVLGVLGVATFAASRPRSGHRR